MVEMRVGIDHVTDRLVRDQPLRLRDNLVGAHVVLRPFDHHDVILEIGDDGGVAARDQPEASAKIFRDWPGRLTTAWTAARSAAPTASGRLSQIHGDVRLYIRHVQFEVFRRALILHDVGRKLNAAEVFPIGVRGVPDDVAEHVVVDLRLDLFHVAQVVDVTGHWSLVVTREREHRVRLAFDFLRLDGRVFLERRFQKTFGQENELQLRGPRRVRIQTGHHVLRRIRHRPGVAAAASGILAFTADALQTPASALRNRWSGRSSCWKTFAMWANSDRTPGPRSHPIPRRK